MSDLVPGGAKKQVLRATAGSIVATAAISGWAADAASAQTPSPLQNFIATGAASGFAWPSITYPQYPQNLFTDGVVVEGANVNLGCGTEATVANVSTATEGFVGDSGGHGVPTYTEITIDGNCDSNINAYKNAIETIIGNVNGAGASNACSWWGGVMLDEEMPANVGYGFTESQITTLNEEIDSYITSSFSCSGDSSPQVWSEAFWSGGTTCSDYDTFKNPNNSTSVEMAPQVYTNEMATTANCGPAATMTWNNTKGYAINSYTAANAAVTNAPYCLAFGGNPCAETWDNYWYAT